MKMPKIDYKAILMQTAGEGVGLFALGKLQDMKFVKEKSSLMKGLIYKVLGRVVVPVVAGKVKRGSELISGVGDVLSIAGTSQIVNSFKSKEAGAKDIVPSIGGYEDYVLNGPGVEMEGVEDDDPNAVEGYEDEVMQ